MNGKKMEMCYQSENSYFWAEGLLIIFCCCFTGRFYLFSKFYERVLFMKLKKQGFFPFPPICLPENVNCSMSYNIIWNNLNV